MKPAYIRCMGGRFCNHAPGTCTASAEYQTQIPPRPERKIIAYRVEPVRELEPGGIATAALITCMATGEVLSGMGGGGRFLSPRVYELLKDGGCTITKDDYAWLIEHGASQVSAPLYWGGVHNWTPDHLKAVRFPREIDAQSVAESMDDGVPDGYRIAMHSWA